jgi:Rho GTPase-activating protein 1
VSERSARPVVLCACMPPGNLSLKQRLAALSLAPSSPSSPLGVDTPLSPTKWKKFTPPWGKRTGYESGADGEQRTLDRVQDAMSRLIFQAGVDYQ